MKTTQHTPGKWKHVVYHNSENGATRIEIESAVAPYQIARIYHDEIDHAHLIAAAPELLEACEAALDYMVDPAQFSTTDVATFIEVARAAIAKAEQAKE